MKKLLAVVLSLALALGLSVSAFAGSASNKNAAAKDVKDIGINDAAELLKKLDASLSSMPDEDRDFFDKLLAVEYLDDDSYIDYAIVQLLLILNGELPDEAVRDALLVLYVIDYLDEGEDDVQMLIKLFDKQYDEDSQLQMAQEINYILAPLADGSHDELDELYANLLAAELFDNDDLTDVEALLRYPVLFTRLGFNSEDLITVLEAVAIIDALDDNDFSDYELVLEYIKALYESYGESSETYENLVERTENIINTVIDEKYVEADSMIPQLILNELFDDYQVTDLFLLMQILSHYDDEDVDDEELMGLLHALILTDYYDNYDDTDFFTLLDHIRLFDKEDGDTEYGELADNLLHLAWILNPEGVENDPLAE